MKSDVGAYLAASELEEVTEGSSWTIRSLG